MIVMKDISPTVRVMIVDDTIVYRRLLSDVINQLDHVTLVATAINGKDALEKIAQSSVDLILLDVEMPEMDGLATLEVVAREYPDIVVIMISGASQSSADYTIKALEKGAIDFIVKPDRNGTQENRQILKDKIQPMVKQCLTRMLLRQAKQKTNSLALFNPDIKKVQIAHDIAVQRIPVEQETKASSSHIIPALSPDQIDVLVLAVSTGGPKSLAKLIPELPANLGIPVLLVQHMPPVFTHSLANDLNSKSAISVREAQAGEIIEANTVYIAPGGKHMVVHQPNDKTGNEKRFTIGLNDNPPENGCRPAADVLFRSVAAQYGKNILAVVMTGMGTDGREGIKAMKRKGCLCLTQSEETCVIYGMPQAVAKAGLSDESVPLDALPSRIMQLIQNPRIL